MLIEINNYKQIIIADIKVIAVTITIMNFEGGADYVIIFVTRQLHFLFRRHICHIVLCTIYLTQIKYVVL